MKNLLLKIGKGIFDDEIKDIKKYLKSKVYEKCSTSSKNTVMFSAYNDVLFEISKKEYMKHQDCISAKDNSRKLAKDTIYFIRIGKYDIMEVTTSKETYTSSSGEYTYQRLTVKFYGPNRKRAKSIFSRKVTKCASLDDIMMLTIHNRFGTTTSKVSPRPMDSIILDNNVKSALIKSVTTWKNSKDWYLSHFLKYKLGILLYGEPGCGKSSLIQAIASMLDRSWIIKFDTGNIPDAIEQIQSFVNKQRKTTFIVVIEDIDMIFTKRDESLNGNDEYQKMLKSQNALFQMLDGLYSTDQTIYIATTNHINQLDPALIRPGRFDIVEEIKPFDHTKAIEFLKMFGYDERFYDENVKGKIDLPIQPAKLQAMIMDDRSRKLYNK